MNFEQFCFPDEEPSYWNKPSPSYDSTHPQSNDMRNNGSSQQSEDERNHNVLPTSKLIRKKYDPIRDGERIIKFEDNPSEYRKARKKIQNRISATKVRGKKKTQLEQLQGEVTVLRRHNAQLQLENARMQAENTMLKERVAFLERVVLNKNNQQADSYISTSISNTPSHTSSHYESPFEDLDDNKSVWSRFSGGSQKSRGSWAMLTIFTIIAAVFIMPSQNETSPAMIATKINQLPLNNPDITSTFNILYEHSLQLATIKYYFKVFVIVLYLSFVLALVLTKMGVINLRKLKRF